MSVLVSIQTAAGDARMHVRCADKFDQLRRIVFEGSGIDFLAVCGDVLRPSGYRSTKDGVANRSWHKTGRAFDYDQTSKALIIESEIIGQKQYFRTWLICSGKRGVLKRVRDIRGHTVNTYLFDFTNAAKACAFERIPAWAGWRDSYNRREFWHYQNTEGLTWAAAMAQLVGSTKENYMVGLNDRGRLVSEIQSALYAVGLFAQSEIDGVFGPKTKLALETFQRKAGLDADGLAGPLTRKALNLSNGS